MGWLLPLLLLGAALGVSAVASAGPAHALLAFAAAARGDNARALPDWQPGTDYCGWSGVACDDGAAVTALHLPRSGLRGQLAPDLALLPSLQTIDLSDNALGGRLPARWARLAALQHLRLDRNGLTGGLPATWNMLEDLQYLTLSGNRLNGTLPVAWSSMGRQLLLMDLSGNALSGTLPPAWGRQRWLTRLGLARNALLGALPREWARLAGLLQLDLGGNSLTGTLPAEWGALRQASAVDLGGNALTGALPPAWGSLGSLQMLSLAGNQLSGAVPPQWTQLADRAYRLALGGNPQLCGQVPPALAPAVLAAGASARGSRLGRPCSWEEDAAALLRFKSAILAAPAGPGPAPGAAAQVEPLADWQEGANPCSQGAWTGVSCVHGRVAVLNLANAGLRLPTLEPLAGLSALQELLLAGNTAVNASLPASWAGLSQLEVADLSGAGVSGSLPPQWAGLAGSLRQLRLSGNALSGTLPTSWGELKELESLDVSRNSLTGSLPPEWGTLGSLASLDASSNYLSGGLPDAWKALADLQELRLASNNLGGPIPASWARLPSLTLLDLGSNVGVCGGQPGWRDGTQVALDATNVAQSCIMVGTSGMLAGILLTLAMSVTLASVVAVAALLVYVKRQRAQLAALQRERSAASFSDLGAFSSDPSFASQLGAKLAVVHTFAADGGGAAGLRHKVPGERIKALSIPNPWSQDDERGYIQVPIATPGSGLPHPGSHTPHGAGIPLEEHRSPSPASGMPSPERHQWQVAAQAADRGVDLTARRARQKRLFRSRSEAPGVLAGAAAVLGQLSIQQQGAGQDTSEGLELETLRVHSRVALLPSDGGMV